MTEHSTYNNNTTILDKVSLSYQRLHYIIMCILNSYPEVIYLSVTKVICIIRKVPGIVNLLGFPSNPSTRSAFTCLWYIQTFGAVYVSCAFDITHIVTSRHTERYSALKLRYYEHYFLIKIPLLFRLYD